MKNNLIKFAAFLALLAVLMVAEYRYIMLNVCPYIGDGNTVYIEVFGQVDEYEAIPAEKLAD